MTTGAAADCATIENVAGLLTSGYRLCVSPGGGSDIERLVSSKGPWRAAVGLPSVLLFLFLVSACQGTGTESGDVDLSGFFSVMYGDPPPDSGLPAIIEYWLTDEEGRDWLLVFDEEVYRPAGGLRQFDRAQVEVEGTATDEETILVTSVVMAETTRDPALGQTRLTAQATTPDPAATATAGPAGAGPSEVTHLLGFFSVMYGDPPTDSGLPAVIEYWLTDEEGRDWLLVFDEEVYRPAGGLRQFDRAQVEVEGTAIDDETILVAAISVAG